MYLLPGTTSRLAEAPYDRSTGHRSEDAPALPGTRLATRGMGAVAAAAVLIVGLSGCSGNKGVKPDARKAAAEVSAGLSAQSAGKLDEATSHYNEALKYEHANKYALYDLALIDAANSNLGQAEQKYQAVLAIDPAYEPALFNLAILQKGKGNNQQALSLYRRAVAAAPRDASAHLNLGLLLRELGQKVAGDLEVKKALTLNPKLRDPSPPAKTTSSVTASPSASHS